jgi:F-type H+-transporting ATPase subunit alpha
LRGKNVDILTNIRDSRDLNDDTATKLRSVVEGFAKTFA